MIQETEFDITIFSEMYEEGTARKWVVSIKHNKTSEHLRCASLFDYFVEALSEAGKIACNFAFCFYVKIRAGSYDLKEIAEAIKELEFSVARIVIVLD